MGDNADKKILVSDDSSVMRRILVNILNQLGFTQVSQAANGMEALAECEKTQFDCFLVDWNMPELDGLGLLTRLRKMPNYTNTPVIMITSENHRPDVFEALTKGVTDYIVKPFTPDILKAKLEESLAEAEE